jgi:Flp pilus assembly protein TadG
VRTSKQHGVAAVEFALLAALFFAIVFGILEIARLVYLFNTLQEVTRRAAALAINSPFSDDDQKTVRQQALFADKAGNLVLGNPVTPDHLRLEYLSLSRTSGGVLAMQAASPLPASPEANRLNCLSDPYGTNCIRFVRVRVCQPNVTDSCRPVPYQMLFPLVNFSGLTLPRSTTIAPAQTMGYKAGAASG